MPGQRACYLLVGLLLGYAGGRALRAKHRARTAAHEPEIAPVAPPAAPAPAPPATPSPPPDRRYSAVTLALGALALVVLLVAIGGEVTSPGSGVQAPSPTRVVRGGDAARGQQAIIRRGCGACHVIPGIPGARGRVGPQLTGFVRQRYVAGVLVNEPDNLVRWLRHPRQVDPLTAMPDLGLTPEEARDVAAYLYQADR